MLAEKDERLLARLGWTQRAATAFGIVLTLAGAAYVTWALVSFDPRADPREQPAFDRPIARLAFLYHTYQGILDHILPETDTEKILLSSMKHGMNFSAGIVVMLVRLLIGSLVCMSGLVALTVVVERRRLLRMIAVLRGP